MNPCRCDVRGLLLITLFLSCFTEVSLAHPDKVEDRLLFHFATGAHPPVRSEWQDLTHKLTATLKGEPSLAAVGPAQAMMFNGYTDWLLLAPDLETARPFLPKREFSISAWVVLEKTAGIGGILGFIQDNGNYEKGWALGYNQTSFVFSVSSQATDDGDGRLAYVVGKKTIVPGRWHHVAAVYDGSKMRLFVNGEPDGESSRASGDVIYPEKGRLAAAAYVDDNELFPMEGGFFEVKAYGRALSPEEVRATAQKGKSLLEYQPSINTTLNFAVKPFVQYANETSVRIVAETTAQSTMRVEYANQQPLRMRKASRGPSLIHEVLIDDLERHASYFYRVICEDSQGNAAKSDLRSFQTLPPKTMPWSFGVIGDTQRNPRITQACGDLLYSFRPNAVIHCGDVVDDGFAKHQWTDELFSPLYELMSRVPLYPVIGNHEKNAHWYYDYFSLPAPEYYYTFKVGNAEFFMIDSNKDCGPGSDQYKWLQRDLAASKAEWKFTAHHHPCFSSDENDYGDHLTGRPDEKVTWGDTNVRRLVPLYEKYGVDIAFAGHVHSYERTWPILNMSINQKKGVRYLVSGGGGGSLEQAAPQRSWFTLHVKRGYHVCVAAVAGRTMEFKAYDYEGRLFDSFQLTKP